jgi:hypothetical protein
MPRVNDDRGGSFGDLQKRHGTEYAVAVYREIQAAALARSQFQSRYESERGGGGAEFRRHAWIEGGRMEVDVGVQEILAEGVDLGGRALGDMRVAEVFAHDGAVLGLRQAVVVAVSGPRFGELDAELVQGFGHGVVDVLRAVVGMKAQELEGEAGQDLFQDGQ